MHLRTVLRRTTNSALLLMALAALGLLQECAGRMERAGTRKHVGVCGQGGQAFLPVLNRRLGSDRVDSSRPQALSASPLAAVKTSSGVLRPQSRLRS
jgi:hypothetical protein